MARWPWVSLPVAGSTDLALAELPQRLDAVGVGRHRYHIAKAIVASTQGDTEPLLALSDWTPEGDTWDHIVARLYGTWYQLLRVGEQLGAKRKAPCTWRSIATVRPAGWPSNIRTRRRPQMS